MYIRFKKILMTILSGTGLVSLIRLISISIIKKTQTVYYTRRLEPLVSNSSNGCIPPVSKQTKKTVLHINTTDIIGGAALLAYNLSCRLPAHGIDSELAVSEKHSDDARVHVIPRSRSIVHAIINQGVWLEHGEKKWGDSFKLSINNIKQTGYFKNADLVHLHNIHGGYFSPFFLPELTRLKPVIWTLHDDLEIIPPCGNESECVGLDNGCLECRSYKGSPSDNRMPGLIWKNKKEMIHKSNIQKIICPSRWLKDMAEKSYLKDKDIRVIYNGIDTDRFRVHDKADARQRLGLPARKVILLFIAKGGISTDIKGGKLIREIFTAMDQSREYYFIIIGGERNYETSNWKEVSYIKDHDTLAYYYSAADLFINPTLKDVFGLVAAESISCGTPVITFATGGVPEVVEHMKTGYVADYADVRDLINGIKVFKNNAHLTRDVLVNGHGIIEKKFSLHGMTRKYVDVYNEIFENYCRKGEPTAGK